MGAFKGSRRNEWSIFSALTSKQDSRQKLSYERCWMNDWREHVCKQEKSRCLEFFDNLSSCINIIFDHDELLNIPFNKQNFWFFFPHFLSVWLDQNFLTTFSDPADISVYDAPLQEDTQFSPWDREVMRKKWSVCLILKEKVMQSEGSFQLLQVFDIFDHLTEIKCVCTGRLWSDVIFYSAFKLGSEVRTNLK